MMKKALLVGINKYSDSPLRGCVNDCLLMYKILSEKLGFNTKDINLITDYDCTKKNIIRNLENLIYNAQSGDIIFFHYSGHGSQVVVNDWTSTNEADGLDEILCPIDLDWNDPLRDKDLNALFKSVKKGVRAVVVLDCCHSGNGLRNSVKYIQEHETESDWINRFSPPPPSNILTNPKISIDDELGFVMPKFNLNDPQTIKNSFLKHTIKQGDAILISGCQENQVSADAWIGGRYHGALTYTLVKVLHRNNYKITNKRLVKGINKRLDRLRYSQNPQLECKGEFFDQNFLFV